MCGIFGYLNYCTPCTRKQIIDVLITGLQRLEYRGYDSAGICVDDDTTPEVRPYIIKEVGNIAALRLKVNTCVEESSLNMSREFQTHLGISHTRWATHGVPSTMNAHPHTSDLTNEFVVVHNGIITNYKELRTFLTGKGYKFESDTDTEVVPKLTHFVYHQLIEEKTAFTFAQLVVEVLRHLDGAYALLFKSFHFSHEIVAVKKGSPLIVGFRVPDDNKYELKFTDRTPKSSSKDYIDSPITGRKILPRESPNVDRLHETDKPSVHIRASEVEYFFASDASAIIEHTRKVIYLEDGDLAFVKDGHLEIENASDAELNFVPTKREVHTLQMELTQIMKGNYDHFMQKEIFEQPDSVVNTMRGRINFEKYTIQLGGIKDHLAHIRRGRRLIFLGCGTSYHAGVASRYIVEKLTQLPVVAELASDFLDREPPVFRDDVCIFISQSGETADTMRCLEYCLSCGCLCLGITNTVGSSIARATHCGIHINAGAEIGVASTKAYTSQVICILMLALKLSEDSISLQHLRHQIIDDLKALPDHIRSVLSKDQHIKDLCGKFINVTNMILMGRGAQFATCLEGALKIKEVSYIHSEGVMAGELKHGPIALIDKDMPVLIIGTRSDHYSKIQNALHEVMARGGRPIIICNPDDAEMSKFENAIIVPDVSEPVQLILNVIPLQLIAYYFARARGLNVDCPRNLAKSVTVE